MTGSVLLLRAVNVGGRNRVPMARLRSILADETDLIEVSTYIASGNIVCATPQDPEAACAAVQRAIAGEFAVETPVIHRAHGQLAASIEAQSFSDGEERFVHALFLAGSAKAGAVEALEEHLLPDERLALVHDDLWIAYGTGGAHSTKLSTAVLDRALGVAGTARNLRTVRRLIELTA